jgi:hypothetical protein
MTEKYRNSSHAGQTALHFLQLILAQMSAAVLSPPLKTSHFRLAQLRVNLFRANCIDQEIRPAQIEIEAACEVRKHGSAEKQDDRQICKFDF